MLTRQFGGFTLWKRYITISVAKEVRAWSKSDFHDWAHAKDLFTE